MLAGAAIGLARGVGELAGPTDWTGRDTVSVVSSVVLYALAGLVAGFVTARLREAERRISLAQAREEVARTLHDGVLQTLAVVQRRTGDPDIVRLAHEQERELREFLFGTPGAVGGGGDLGHPPAGGGGPLRGPLRRLGHRGRAPTDTPAASSPRSVDALAGAVGEALANAGKHGGAGRVTVFAEPHDDGDLFCSVKDDGPGFDAGDHARGRGPAAARSGAASPRSAGGSRSTAGRGGAPRCGCWVPVRGPERRLNAAAPHGWSSGSRPDGLRSWPVTCPDRGPRRDP